MAPGSSSMGLDVPMTSGGTTSYSEHHVSSGSMDLRYTDDTWWQPKSWVSTWPLVLTQATDINTDPSYRRTMDPDMVLGSSPGQDHTIASSYLPVPYRYGISSFTFLYSV